jgi:hypothetical protein
MKRLNILLLCLMAVQLITAQNSLDILTLSGRYASPCEYDSLLSGNAKETGGFAALTVPIPLANKKTIIYNSLNYFYFHVDNDPILSDDVADPFDLHGFILRTGIIQRLSNGRSIQFLLAPRYMSDMKGGGMDNFQFGFLAMYEKKFSEKLTMGFGGMFNQEFFGPYFVPLVNLNWMITERFSITGLLPIYGKIKYRVNSKFSAGISHFGLLTTFGLNDPAYEEDYLERQSIDLALFGNYNLRDNFYLEVRFGQSLNRSYRQYGPDQKIDFGLPLVTFGDDRVPKNIPFKSGLFGELRLIYSILIPEE